MGEYILDLQTVACPFNLFLVKKAVYENNFANGGKIIIQGLQALENIKSYLVFKKINFSLENSKNENDDGVSCILIHKNNE